MINLIRSEWIKLTSTKALWWTTFLALVIPIALTVMSGVFTGQNVTNPPSDQDPSTTAQILEGLSVDGALSQFLFFGLMIIMIQAVMTVTTEYGSGTAKTTLLATPSRWPVAVAKLLTYGTIAAVISFVTAVLSVVGMHWAAGLKIEDAALLDRVSLGADSAWTMIGRLVLYTVLSVVISLGVGYLTRNTAGGIALLLLWKLVLEGILLGTLPWVRDHIAPFGPFSNIDNAAQMKDVTDAPWGQTGSILYFAAWCAVIFILGVVALKRRDA